MSYLISGTGVLFIVYIIWFFLDLPEGFDMLYGSVVSLGLIALYVIIRNNNRLRLPAKLFAIFGSVSLELYLVHTVILRVVDNNQISNLIFAALFIILPIVTLLLSKLYSIITRRIQKFLLKPKPVI